MTTKPQHEQDYEMLKDWVSERPRIPARPEYRQDVLTRLHAEAAKVPGLEAQLATAQSLLTDAIGGVDQQRARAESERHTARQERADTIRYLQLLDQLIPDVAGDDTDTLLRGYGDAITALRERVATLEEKAKKLEVHGEYRAQRRDEERARADAAEARVRELEANLAGARLAALEEAANLLDEVESANPVGLIRALISQPAPAPTQGDSALTQALADLKPNGAAVAFTFDSDGSVTSVNGTPTPPALVEAVGYALEILTSAGSHPNVVARLRAAYDAAKGGASGVDGPVFNQGRHEGRSDVFVAVLELVDPSDTNHWNLDGVLKEVARNAEDAAKYRAAVERAKDATRLGKAAYEGQSEAPESEWSVPWEVFLDFDREMSVRQGVAVARYVLGIDTSPSGPGGES